MCRAKSTEILQKYVNQQNPPKTFKTSKQLVNATIFSRTATNYDVIEQNSFYLQLLFDFS